MERQRKRHCWECRRRCLVCDFTEPACKRCCTAGIECPGYSETKPVKLKWLAPGRVISRGRSRNEKSTKRINKSHKGVPAQATTNLVLTKIDTPMPRFHVLFEAMQYFNSCMYRDLIPIHELGQNPHIYQLSAVHVRQADAAPDYLQYGMLCMTLCHRINRTRSDPQFKVLVARFYQYWGLAVRSLNEHLNAENGWLDDMAVAGIMTILLADVAHGTSLNWKCHVEGVHRLIALRGGFHAVAESKSLYPLLLCFWSVAVFGNTTCPASDLVMTGSQLDLLELLIEKYGAAVTPFQMCPPPLFAEMIRINHLRMRAAEYGAAGASTLSQSGCEILERIHGFRPEQWAKFKVSSTEDWTFIGKTYQAAVALYCILSLQSLSVLPMSLTMRALCAAHGQHLRDLLEEGLSSRKIKRFMIWPLVLLGVQGAQGGAEMRAFVAKKLPELSHDVGTSAPLTAKRVLELFWTSGETRWDACFGRSYVFTSQIAVDTSRLYSCS